MPKIQTPTQNLPPQKRRRLLPTLAPVIIFVAVAGLFLVALQKGDPSKIPSALIGRPAPIVDLSPVPGLTRAGLAVPGFATADLAQGKPAVVNFWASWCLPCADEHPHLVELARRTGVALYGINNKDQPANAARFLSLHGNPYRAIGADANGRAAIEWGVYGMPETFIVDGKGTVVFKHVGPITAQSLEQSVLPALAKASAAP
jgi:cytochrome c biogenesis protein CcmG, thiol:disulfide interchange protein DsbE